MEISKKLANELAQKIAAPDRGLVRIILHYWTDGKLDAVQLDVLTDWTLEAIKGRHDIWRRQRVHNLSGAAIEQE